MLDQLIQASASQLPTRAQSIVAATPREASQLALDLIVYTWALKTSSLPSDISSADTIASAIASAANDSVINWARELYSSQNTASIRTLPPRDDERVNWLADLQRQYGAASDYADSSPVEAVKALTTALDLCRRLRLDLTEAIIQKKLGDHYLSNMSRYRQAEECYSRAIWLFSAYNCTASAAVAYDDYGTLNSEMGRYSAATDNFVRSAQQWLALAKSDSSGYKYRDSAGAEYMRAGAAQAAALNSEKALQLMTDYGLAQLRIWAHSTKSYSDFIRNLIRVAQLYQERSDTGKALDLLKEAQRACDVEKDPILTAKVLNELARTYSIAQQKNNADKATHERNEMLENTVTAGKSALAKLIRDSAMTATDRTNLQLTAERSATADQELGNTDASAQCWERMAEIYKKGGQIDAQVRCLRSLASILDSQQKYSKSLVVRREAVVTAMQANRKPLAATVGREMVQAFIDSGDLANALEGFTELAPIFESSGDARGAAETLKGRGILLASHGQNDAAIEDLKESRSRYLDQVGDAWAAGEVSLNLAGVQQAEDDIRGATATLERALDDIESKYSDENLDPSANPQRGKMLTDLYRRLATVYVQQDRTSDATKLFRKAKRYTWIPDLIRSMKSDSNANVAAWAQNLDIVIGTQPAGNTPGPGNEGRILADNWAKYVQACWMLKSSAPTAYTSLPADPLDFFRFRQSLPKDGAIIEYMPSESAVNVFICGNGKSVCMELPASRDDIDVQITNLRKLLKSAEESLSTGIPVPPISDWQEKSFLEIREPLIALYSQLIEPLRDQIADRKQLFFMMPGSFAGLPMHCLISSGTERTPKFLIEDYAISYLSEGMLNDLLGRSGRQIDSERDRVAIFANPDGNLPGAEAEAKAIEKAYFNSYSYIGSKATATNFLKECEKAGVLHVAAHYRIGPNPAKFALELAPDGGSPGTITIDELSGISSDHLGLVVLSACDSISSSDPISSGPSKVAEVFSMAGAKSVMGGLWKVSDDAAAAMMANFYRSLGKGKPRAEALRLAQLAVIESKQYAHPFYWACFALYGNPW